MKLFVVTQYYNNLSAGSERHIQYLLEYFVSKGHTCICLFEKTVSGQISSTLLNGVQLYKAPPYVYETQMLKIFNNEKPDVLCGVNDRGFDMLRIFRNKEIPKVLFLKNTIYIRDKIKRQQLKLFPPDLIVVDSDYVARMFKKITKVNIIISSPVLPRHLILCSKINRKYITMVNYTDEKGKYIFKQIADKLKNRSFLAVRSWMPFIPFPPKHDHNIIINGPFKDIKEIYKQTRLLLVPTLSEETFGQVAYEALSNGIPVIANNIGALPELLKGSGILINDYHDIDLWVKEIKKFDTKHYYELYSQRAIIRASVFRSDNEYEKIESSINRCIQDYKRHRLLIRSKLFFRKVKRFIYYSKPLIKITQSFMSHKSLSQYISELLFSRYEFLSKPADVNFGWDRGGPIDRYYIEDFLRKNKNYIHGRVLEVGDNRYTNQFGGQKVITSDVLNVLEEGKRTTIIGDLTNKETLPSNIFDCFICTQTFQFINNIQKAAINSLFVLKKGGVLLLTVPGVAPIPPVDYRKYGMYWCFTDMSVRKMFSNYVPDDNIHIETYGNVKAASAFLYGFGYPEMDKRELDIKDKKYQVIITARIIKS